jgi:acyl-CoA synthetase (AMP-forming)/AMP-acid ligase II
MYGCTENSPRVTYCWLPEAIPDHPAAWPVGRPVAGTSVRIVDGSGKEMEPNSVGDIVISGTSLMTRYLGQPGLTGQRVADGWFATQDRGFLDERGDLHLVGRADNVFSVGHEKVAPEEVEELIGSVAGVRDVAVGPLPDPILGSITVALVATDGDYQTLLTRIRNACVSRLPRSKQPRRYFRVVDIPRTAYGKIDRSSLRSLLSDLGRSIE